MLNHLFSGSEGFAKSVRISAGLNSGLLVVANLLMRKRLPPKEGSKIPFADFARDLPYVILVIGYVLPYHVASRPLLNPRAAEA